MNLGGATLPPIAKLSPDIQEAPATSGLYARRWVQS